MKYTQLAAFECAQYNLVGYMRKTVSFPPLMSKNKYLGRYCADWPIWCLHATSETVKSYWHEIRDKH